MDQVLRGQASHPAAPPHGARSRLPRAHDLQVKMRII
jgi:hypothetical protein